jgi:hypothetical protein
LTTTAGAPLDVAAQEVELAFDNATIVAVAVVSAPVLRLHSVGNPIILLTANEIGPDILGGVYLGSVFLFPVQWFLGLRGSCLTNCP